MAIFNNTNSRLAGVINELMETWRVNAPAWEKEYEPFVRTLGATTIRNAPYAFKEALPFPRHWPMGKGRVRQGFKDVLIEMPLTPYELTIAWNRYDEEDDQLGDLRAHVNMAVQRYGLLAYTLFSEYLNGTAVLNSSLITAYDGASICSATDGDGNDRLGVSGGNVLTGSGLTVSGVIRDVAKAQQRGLSYLDPTANRVIFSYDMMDYKNLVLMGPKEANQVFQQASGAENIKISNDNMVSESNVQKGTWSYVINNLLTDSSDYYIFIKHPLWRPFIHRRPKNINSIVADITNSDRARDFNENAIMTDIRTQFAPYFPGTIIKVDNS